MHIHVRKAEQLAKFWIQPEIALAESYALGSPELKMLENIVRDNKLLIESKWHDFFGD